MDEQSKLDQVNYFGNTKPHPLLRNWPFFCCGPWCTPGALCPASFQSLCTRFSSFSVQILSRNVHCSARQKVNTAWCHPKGKYRVSPRHWFTYMALPDNFGTWAIIDFGHLAVFSAFIATSPGGSTNQIFLPWPCNLIKESHASSQTVGPGSK